MSATKKSDISMEDDGWSTLDEFDGSDAENEELQLMQERCMKDVLDLIDKASEVNSDDSLTYNKEMQRQLLLVTRKLTEFLQIVQNRYDKNAAELELLLKPMKCVLTKSGAFWRGRTFLFTGSMFFRDAQRKSCPNNPDYTERKGRNEMFPSDFDLIPNHVWSMLDKVKVVQGIKAQVLAYLKDWQKHNAFKFKPSVYDNVELHTVRLARLLQKVDNNFRIDWNEISIHDLQSRHTPKASEALWKMSLKPGLNYGRWSKEENERLREAAIKYKSQDWKAFADAVGRRSEFQCFLQHQTTVIYRLPSHLSKWKKEDDGRLIETVKKYTINGMIQWSLVAAHFPHKPIDNIRWHYNYRLNPTISHAAFTASEDLLLLAALKHYDNFAQVPRTLFPNRSLVQLRSRYNNSLVDRHKRAPWSIEDDKKLLHFVAKHGRSQWSKCAHTLGNHSRISCRTRFLTIERNVRKDPHITVDEIPRSSHLKMSTVVTTQNWSEKVSEMRENPLLSLKPKKRPKTHTSKIKKSFKAMLKDLKNSSIKAQIVGSSSSVSDTIKTESGFLEAEIASTTTSMQIAVPQENAPRNSYGKKKRSRQKPLYKQRLRKLGLCLYNSFKFTYNFKCGEAPLNGSSSASQGLPQAMVFYGLKTKAAIKSEQSLDAVLKTLRRIIRVLTRSERSSDILYLPPSGSSLIAARNIEILSVHNHGITFKTTNTNKHVEKFKQMMGAFILSACMLMQIEGTASGADLDILAILGNDENVQQSSAQTDSQTHGGWIASPLERINDPPSSTGKRRLKVEEIVEELPPHKKKIAKLSS